MVHKRRDDASLLGVLLILLPLALCAKGREEDKDMSDGMFVHALNLMYLSCFFLVDIEKLNGIVNRVKAKFDSADYFLDDPQPGDYFDRIAVAGSYLARAAKPVGLSKVVN